MAAACYWSFAPPLQSFVISTLQVNCFVALEKAITVTRARRVGWSPEKGSESCSRGPAFAAPASKTSAQSSNRLPFVLFVAQELGEQQDESGIQVVELRRSELPYYLNTWFTKIGYVGL